MNKSGIKTEISFIYFISFILSACSILYELLIARTVAYFMDNLVVWCSVTMGLYLCAMGLGSGLFNRFIKNKNLWLSLFKIEILLSLIGAISVMGIYLARLVWRFLAYNDFYGYGQCLFFVFYLFIVIGIGVLTGLELPLFIKLGKNLSEKNISNRILGFDYFGSLVGAVSFPLLLLPLFGLIHISFIIAFINFFISLIILMMKDQCRIFSKIRLSFASVLLVVFLLCFAYTNNIQQYFWKKDYYFVGTDNLAVFLKPNTKYKEIESYHTPYQKIDIVKFSSYANRFVPSLINAFSTKYIDDPNYPRLFKLYFDGNLQFDASFDEIYHEYFVHVPIILNNKIPEKILVLGAGDGLLIKELIKYKDVRSITHVEIDEKMIHLARTHPDIKKCNDNALSDPRVNIIIGDAYHFVRNDQNKYDAIYMDFPRVVDYNLNKLYSREFHGFVRKHLNPGGFAVTDALRTGLIEVGPDGSYRLHPKNTWSIHYNTLKDAGFSTIVPYSCYLDVDNVKAFEALGWKSIDDMADYFESPDMYYANERKYLAIKNQIVWYVDGLREGFIMVKNEAADFEFKYKEMGVKLHVLNEANFNSAFEFSSLFTKDVDREKVNSIMRPSLIDLSFEGILGFQ